MFAPEIDPRLLVRARAQGIPIESILESLNGKLPPYRFSYLLIKAKEYAGVLQGFGSALLGAIEKRESEELNQLRLAHQEKILIMTRDLRLKEISAAEEGFDGLLQREKTILSRQTHYDSLIEEGLTLKEKTQYTIKVKSNNVLPIAEAIYALSAKLSMFPTIAGFSYSITTGEKTTENMPFF